MAPLEWLNRFGSDLKDWLSRFGRWLGEPRRIWLTLLSIVAIPIVFVVLCWVSKPWLGKDASDGLRYAGLVLQWAGIYTVLHGISGKQRLFDKPDSFKAIGNWWNRRPRWGRKPRTVHATARGGLSFGGSADVSAWKGRPARESGGEIHVLWKTVNALWENLETLRRVQERDAAAAGEAIKKLHQEHRKTTTEAKASLAEIRIKVEALAVGVIQVEVIGLMWLFAGVAFTTIPGEVAEWVADLLKVNGG